ncbi:MAG: amidohydrolase family protein, partial [Planctomycetota bacterium]|nr:amidohydrolase family protein [Planctomycetota bacterium]
SGPVFEKGQMAPVRRPAAFARSGCMVAILPYRRGITLAGLAGRDLATLHVDAAFAIRGGMSNEEALKAITLNPARILRVDDRLGSLEKGKDADLLILSGHPLDYRSFVLKAYINGKLYYDRSKSRIFREIPMTGEK